MVKDYQIVETPWLNRFYSFVGAAQDELFLVTPFFSKRIIQEIVKHARPHVKLRFLLGANTRGILDGVCDYEAVIFLHKQTFQRDIIVKNIPNLHAKVIISDKKRAILSSSNFTHQGLKKNIEFGIEARGEIAKELYTLVKKYWDLAETFQFNIRAYRARNFISRSKNRQKKNGQIISEIPLALGKHISPKGNDPKSAPSVATPRILVSHPKLEELSKPNDKANLLFNVWWNDNGFKGPCLDISNKIVCRRYFIRTRGKDLTKGCEAHRDGCDSAYIFTNFAYYLYANLD